MKIFLPVLLALFLAGCGIESTDHASRLTVDPSQLKFRKGDCLEFKLDTLTYGVGIVFDFSKDEGGIWYGLLLTDYESKAKPIIDSILDGRFLGRKISTSLIQDDFIIGMDAAFIHDSLLNDNFSLVGNVRLTQNVKMGSQGATSNMDGLIQSLKYGKERRLRPPDDYREHLTKLDQFRPDEYFNVRDFIQN